MEDIDFECSLERPISQATIPKLDSQTSLIRCELEMKTLWHEFNALGTEMIVTKAGR